MQETHPSAVTFHFNSMEPGTHVMAFKAVAATAGEFVLPPVKVYMNDAPEVMGLSSAGSLTVCSGTDCQAVEDNPSNIPKSCPKNCSNNGACDLDSGTCVCLKEFKGADCSELVLS